ncbi:polymorphic toxin-type HINT domain-containing protein [Streptomyces yaizuensis]|uniref:polymorphic toxin-type HINT domain-containing protein n=1 Tax=Streptomyces yaizuensis TaxID=2989713 RepID=UPI002B21EC87|nr:polymorphic toxin-type HINT domain-containing protein [Streptomyces sp. YSPA8]
MRGARCKTRGPCEVTPACSGCGDSTREEGVRTMRPEPRPAGAQSGRVQRRRREKWMGRARGAGSVLLPTVLLVGLLGQTPAAATEPGAEPDPVLSPQDRGFVLYQWEIGGRGVRTGAEKALRGSDDDIAAFLKDLEGIQRIDDRVAAGRMINDGGPAVRAAALTALRSPDPQQARDFLKDGWKKPLEVDRRAEAGKIINAGGRGVRNSGVKALQGAPGDVAQFLTEGQHRAREVDNRAAVGKLINFGGPNMKTAGEIALKGTPADVLEFLEIGQHVARSRDQEHVTVAQLAEQAEQAGARAEQATEEAIEAKDRAIASSALAKEAAELAAQETEAAGKDAQKAARLAQQAADAAKGAAQASQQAVAAAEAANRASRVAALAAAQAANAAAGAADAAAHALSAAAAAAGDATKAEEANKAAARARAAAEGAKKARQAVDKAIVATLKAADAAQAARGATANAYAAADAAENANRHAEAAGVHSSKAKTAAAETRRHAREADRAATAAENLARTAARVAGQARDAADSAARHAENAALAAEEAARHAGDSATAAAQANKHAEAARQAAEAATTAVTTAKEVFALARKTETEDLATRTTAAVELARSRKDTSDEFTVETARALLDVKDLQDDAVALTARAVAPDADTTTLVPQGRALALRVLKTHGSWRQEAARGALTGGDEDVLDYLRTGWEQAEQDEIRQQVADLATTSPYDAVRTAAAAALTGTAEQIRTFHTTGQHQVATVDYRARIGKIHNNGGTSVKTAAEKALTDGSPKALTDFLNSGQYRARNVDERAAAGKLYNDGGPEMKAAAMIALSGPADQLHAFIEVGQYMADRKDQLADTHVAQVQQLIHEADVVAARARQNRWIAAEAAAHANKASAEAQDAAAQAAASAAEAIGYADQAHTSAAEAARSAGQAGESARTARAAAERAEHDAAAAEESAAQAEFSASYARQSASLADEAAGDAFVSALLANQSANEAKGHARQAWASVIEKREAELAEARRKAEEQRKQAAEEASQKKKRYCNVNPYRDGVPGCLLASHFQPGEWIVEFPASDPSVLKLAGEMFGVNDALECLSDPSFTGCAIAGFGLVPLVGELTYAKYAKYLDQPASKKVDDLGSDTRYAEIVAKCVQCFLPGTQVLMADHSTKPIESVGPGDQVIATDPRTGETGPRAVTDLIVTESDRRFSELTLTTSHGEERITATDEHPFWSPSHKDWIKAADLRAGMTLRAFDGTTVTVRKNLPRTQYARTYTLDVDDPHTFYVLAGKTPVLVHNSECPVFIKQALEELADRHVTTGRMFDPSGKSVTVQISSGNHAPDGWQSIRKDASAFLEDHPEMEKLRKGMKEYSAAYHVETMYAWWVRQEVQQGRGDKIPRELVVAINHPDGVCAVRYDCVTAVPAILPTGWNMTVWHPKGKRRLEGKG